MAGPTTSPPPDFGYSVPVTPPPSWRRMNLSLGLALPEKRLTTSCTVFSLALLLAHWMISTGSLVSPSAFPFPFVEEVSSCPLELRRKASRLVLTPNHGSAHCRSIERTS